MTKNIGIALSKQVRFYSQSYRHVNADNINTINNAACLQWLSKTVSKSRVHFLAGDQLLSSPRTRKFSSPSISSDENEVAVFWDFENCPLPSGFDPFLLRPNIEQALRKSGFLGPMSIKGYGNIQVISRLHALEALSETGIDLHHVPSGGKNSSDRALLIDMLLWTMKQSPPANILLISGDSDFSVLLHKVRMLNYNVLLAAPNKICKTSALVNAANRVWGWPDMATGKGLQGEFCTHDVNVSKGSTSDGHIADNMDDQSTKQVMEPSNAYQNETQTTKSGGEEAAKPSSAKISDAQSLPSPLLEKILHLVKENPGISLSEISKELKPLNINPRSFGFPNFYYMIVSIQQLETRFVDGLSRGERVRLYLARESSVSNELLSGEPTSVESSSDDLKEIAMAKAKAKAKANSNGNKKENPISWISFLRSVFMRCK